MFQDPSINPSRGSPEPVIHSVPESESSASSKEADQPSPVSILEAPFKDDLSSGSECFESLSADLHGNQIAISSFPVLGADEISLVIITCKSRTFELRNMRVSPFIFHLF